MMSENFPVSCDMIIAVWNLVAPHMFNAQKRGSLTAIVDNYDY